MVTGQPTAVDVVDAALRKELLLPDHVRRDAVFTLLADLAAAGLLVTPEHDAQVAARALRKAAKVAGAGTTTDGQGDPRPVAVHCWLEGLARRYERGEAT